jgi:hypothetical protein
VREHAADLDGLVLGHQQIEQGPGDRGRDLGVDLVGGDLEQRFVDGDGVADLLEPTGHRAFGDAFPEFGHCDGNGHGGADLLVGALVPGGQGVK